MRKVAIIATAALAALICSCSAFADTFTTFASGTATGRTVALGTGEFLIQGTVADANDPTAPVGTYRGTYREITTGYTSCPLVSFQGEFTCFLDPAIAHCNWILGRIRLVFGNASAEIPIALQDVTTFRGFHASICLDPNDPMIHDVHIYGSDTRFDTSAFAPVSSNLPPWDDIFVGLDGTSTPLGTGNVYMDTLDFSLVLETV